jgi:hypothetical protein
MQTAESHAVDFVFPSYTWSSQGLGSPMTLRSSSAKRIEKIKPFWKNKAAQSTRKNENHQIESSLPLPLLSQLLAEFCCFLGYLLPSLFIPPVATLNSNSVFIKVIGFYPNLHLPSWGSLTDDLKGEC